MRVAVSQFATSLNTQENLASCIRMINKAAVCEPDLIVLPEFCNTQPWYVDHDQAWNEALAIDGPFLQQIAEQAKKHACYIVLNVTLRREPAQVLQGDKQSRLIESNIKPNISITSCLFSPLGELIQQADKQQLTEQESEFFTRGNNFTETPIKALTTPFGKLALLTGSDGTTFETSRELALAGVQLLCHSLNAFALDDSKLHNPARACENRVFVASANKIGALFSNEQLQAQIRQEQDMAYSGQSSIAQKYLVGAGQSQIVGPDGKVLAKMANDDEGFVFADIDLVGAKTKVGLNNKQRPDGTEFNKQHRPALYQELLAAIKPPLAINNASDNEEMLSNADVSNKVPATANVAIFATYKSNEQAIEDVCHYIENNLSDVIQLPELFFVADKTITNDAQQLAQIACLSEQLIKQISAVLRPFQYVCTSLVIEGMHQAVLISEHGLFARQQQLHFCQRYQWTALGNDLNIIELPLEQGNVNIAMLTADDANMPEMVKVAALNGIHILLVPFDIQEPCEVEYALLSCAAENRICIVAASREKSFTANLSTDTANSKVSNDKKLKAQKSTGLIANLATAPGLIMQLKSAKFNGYINQPLIKYQHGKITKAVVFPVAACTKLWH